MYRILKQSLLFVSLSIAAQVLQAEEQASDPAEIMLGERLFLETRFAQFFFAQGQGGDKVMESSETVNDALPGPFAGQSMNCAACHLVDQHVEASGGGMRSYADFARRSPIPHREDGKTHAVRNSPSLVNASLPRRGGPVFHFDAEFTTVHDLVKETYVGRNYGWLPGERAQAIRHLAQVIRNDDGMGELAQEFGGAYRMVLKGIDASIPAELRLPEEYRIDVDTASDDEIFNAVSLLTAVYVEDLQFSRAEKGEFNGSPYDLFLKKNALPQRPRIGESTKAYSKRLLRKVKRLKNPKFVTVDEGKFSFHDQAFAFGPTELEGMKLFFKRNRKHSQAKAGNCIACHAAPNFTDFALHNTGITQIEYDGLHGKGAFEDVFIPKLATRKQNHNTWLPATEKHPYAKEAFRSIPEKSRPGETDLGVWNIFANPDFPAPQKKIRRLLCREQLKSIKHIPYSHWQHWNPCRKSALLQRSIASFKTPGLRDLGHSAPYMHNGQLDTLEDVIKFYIDVSRLLRNDSLRNPAPDLHGIHLTEADIIPLAAFLRALNEDYE